MGLVAPVIAHANAGETVSALAWRILGRHRGAVERILEANPGLADLGAALPEGTPVTIPVEADDDALNRVQQIQLWD